MCSRALYREVLTLGCPAATSKWKSDQSHVCVQTHGHAHTLLRTLSWFLIVHGINIKPLTLGTSGGPARPFAVLPGPRPHLQPPSSSWCPPYAPCHRAWTRGCSFHPRSPLHLSHPSDDVTLLPQMIRAPPPHLSAAALALIMATDCSHRVASAHVRHSLQPSLQTDVMSHTHPYYIHRAGAEWMHKCFVTVHG